MARQDDDDDDVDMPLNQTNPNQSNDPKKIWNQTKLPTKQLVNRMDRYGLIYGK